jgi:hypothetical protein
MPKSCPSAPAAPGNTLLGMLGPDGRIHNMRTAMAVDQAFVERASQQGPPEARMRFAGTCVTSGCKQWTGTRCGVIDRAMRDIEAAGGAAVSDSLPPCTIRATCRWFRQIGADACAACTLIITETRDAVAAE